MELCYTVSDKDKGDSEMARRRTTLGRGPFGRLIPKDAHADETLWRILANRRPLTEDAVFLCMYTVLRKNQSIVLKAVRQSKNVGGYRYFWFSPDVDLLEVRPNGAIIGYELKGYVKKGRQHSPPLYYEGLHEAMAYLVNPRYSPLTHSEFAGSVFDYVYLVHPAPTRSEGKLNPL